VLTETLSPNSTRNDAACCLSLAAEIGARSL
jgi:hypothetical protein